MLRTWSIDDLAQRAPLTNRGRPQAQPKNSCKRLGTFRKTHGGVQSWKIGGFMRTCVFGAEHKKKLRLRQAHPTGTLKRGRWQVHSKQCLMDMCYTSIKNCNDTIQKKTMPIHRHHLTHTCCIHPWTGQIKSRCFGHPSMSQMAKDLGYAISRTQKRTHLISRWGQQSFKPCKQKRGRGQAKQALLYIKYVCGSAPSALWFGPERFKKRVCPGVVGVCFVFVVCVGLF